MVGIISNHCSLGSAVINDKFFKCWDCWWIFIKYNQVSIGMISMTIITWLALATIAAWAVLGVLMNFNQLWWEMITMKKIIIYYDNYKNCENMTIKKITMVIVMMLTHLGVCDKPKACGGVFHLIVNIMIVVINHHQLRVYTDLIFWESSMYHYIRS